MQLGVHPGLREVPIGGRVALLGRQVGGQVVAVVVIGLVPGQGEQTDQRQCDRCDQDGPGHRTTAAPTFRQNRTRICRLARGATVITAGPNVSAAKTAITMPIANGMPSVWNTEAG